MVSNYYSDLLVLINPAAPVYLAAQVTKKFVLESFVAAFELS